MAYETLGKTFLIFAAVLAVVGLALLLLGKAPFRLPGDIFVQKGRFSFFFPVVTSILVSIALTVVLNIVIRLWRK